jgi:hypothetical protein
MLRTIFFVVLLLPFTAVAEEVIAVVDLKFLKDTGEVSSTLCFEEVNEEKHCATWATFYLFEARVKKVVSGNFSERKFRAWFGVHALKKGNIKNMVAKLRPLPPEHEAAYQIVAWGQKRELYCFDAKENETFNTNIESESTKMQCYGYEAE